MCTRRRALPKIRARFPCIASVSAEEQAGRKSACKGLLVQRIKDHVPPACVGPVVGGLHRRLAAVPERHSSRRLARAADEARRFIIPARCRVSHSRLPARAREGFAGVRQAAALHFRFSVDHMANLFSEEHSSGRYWKQGNGGHLLS